MQLLVGLKYKKLKSNKLKINKYLIEIVVKIKNMIDWNIKKQNKYVKQLIIIKNQNLQNM